jgi:hypothetical protein
MLATSLFRGPHYSLEQTFSGIFPAVPEIMIGLSNAYSYEGSTAPALFRQYFIAGRRRFFDFP